jgi:AraC family transcriptional regulator
MYFLKVYDPLYFAEYNEGNAFYKWAAVEVSSYENIPDGMESVDLPGGLYAVFNYKGMINDTAFYNYIFNSWLPVSLYKIDDRPHFEILGEKYTNDDPESEEESWIPIRHRLLFGM